MIKLWFGESEYFILELELCLFHLVQGLHANSNRTTRIPPGGSANLCSSRHLAQRHLHHSPQPPQLPPLRRRRAPQPATELPGSIRQICADRAAVTTTRTCRRLLPRVAIMVSLELRQAPITRLTSVAVCPLQLPVAPPHHPPQHLYEHLRAPLFPRHHGPQQGRRDGHLLEVREDRRAFESLHLYMLRPHGGLSPYLSECGLLEC